MHKAWSLMGLALMGVAACSGGGEVQETAAPLAAPSPPEPAAMQGATNAGGLTLITDADQVCMVNNQFMGRDQIPVEFEGRTYYGCCAGCVTRIQNDPAIRAAIDPVTGRAVDKASAVMGQDSEGNIVYFESQESFSQYGTRT